jgi:hypothetical protein
MKNSRWVWGLCIFLAVLSLGELSLRADTVNLSVPNTNKDGVVEVYAGSSFVDTTSNVSYVGNVFTGEDAFNAIYKFQTNSALTGQTIASAKLYVYCASITQDSSVNANGVGIKLQHYTSENSTDLEEADMTKTREDVESKTVSATGWLEFDVTGVVSADVTAGYGYTAFCIIPTDSSTTAHNIRLAELSYTSASQAYITVTYGNSSGMQVASWPGDYSSTQGNNGWYYLYAVNDVYDSSETTCALTWDSTNGYYVGGGCGTTIYNGMMLPGDLYLDGTTKESAVTRWVSTVDSNLRITGTFQRKTAYPAQYGINGVICSVRVNGITKWAQEMLSADTDIYSFDVLVTNVSTGDDIDFVVYPGVHNWLDETYMTATIETVEDPTVASWPSSYSSTQGDNGWYYLYAVNDAYASSETTYALTWNSTNSFYAGGGCGTTIYNGMLLPGDLYADGTTKESAVLRWVSTVDSNLRITGTFQRKTAYPAEYGINGVICSVRVNGASKWSQEMLSADTNEYTFDVLLADVEVGDDIDFVVYPGVHDWLDETYLNVTIEKTDESPTSATWPGDFSSTQGDDGWYYLYASNNAYDSSETTRALTWNATNGYYNNGTVNIYSGMVLPGDMYTDGLTRDSAVLRWVSFMDSDVRITGSFQKKTAYPAETGINGVTCEVRVNGVMQWRKELPSEDAEVHSFDLAIPNITSDDDVDFVVYPGFHDWLDETYVNVNISKIATKAPVFSPGGSYISGSTAIKISSETEGATIYYTTNGKPPTTSSNIYSDSVPLMVSDGMTLNAIAVGTDTSAVTSVTYTVPDEGYQVIGSVDYESGLITQNDLRIGNPYSVRGIAKFSLSGYNAGSISDARLHATAVVNNPGTGATANYFVVEHYTYENSGFLSLTDASTTSVERISGVESISNGFTSYSWNIKSYVQNDLAAGWSYSAFRIVRTDADGNYLTESDGGYVSFGTNVYLTVNTAPDTLDRGHQILLRRGLQIIALDSICSMDGSVSGLNLDRMYDANFTTVNFTWWDIAPLQVSYLGEAPGVPWGRLSSHVDYVRSIPQSWEVPYLSNMVNLQFMDEQDISDATNLSAATSWIALMNSRYPHVLAYTNQYGSQSSVSVMQNYMAQAKPDMLMFDAYAFNGSLTGGSPTSLYGYMQKYRLLGLAGNDGTAARPIPYGLWLQLCVMDGWNNHMISESEMRLNQMASWAFGYKVVEAFTYNDQDGTLTGGGYTNQTVLFTGIDDSTPREPQYSYFKALSAESLKLGPALVRLLSTDVRMIMGKHGTSGTTNATPSGVDNDLDNIVGDSYLTSASVTAHPTGINNNQPGDVIIGFFKPLDESFDGDIYSNQKYFMVVNGLTDGSGTAAQTQQKIRLTFNFGTSGITSLQRLSRSTGNVETVSLVSDGNGVYHLDLTLDGGTGDLFKYKTGAPFVGVVLAGDFNNDYVVNATDIDLLSAAINNHSTNYATYDLTKDDKINSADMDMLVKNILKTYYGDADLNGSVGVSDLSVLAAYYNTPSGASWANGDFDGNGAVGVSDLSILAANYNSGSASTISWAEAYAQAFGTTSDAETSSDEATADDSEDTGSTICSSLGLSLIAGLALMGLMIVKLEE